MNNEPGRLAQIGKRLGTTARRLARALHERFGVRTITREDAIFELAATPRPKGTLVDVERKDVLDGPDAAERVFVGPATAVQNIERERWRLHDLDGREWTLRMICVLLWEPVE